MPRIHRLPETVKNIIAAGEVIERPASVVKELIENSLDAESSDIHVEVLRGGKRLITVSDDGIGMDQEDARLCTERYATSKLNTESDLFSITTMGFRGEALSSVAAVSRVRLSTAPRGSRVGTAVESAGGERISVQEISAIGTKIEVRDLFFNMPVRKKFLRTDHTELVHCIDVVTKASLIHHPIRFRLIADGREILDLHRAADMKERIMQIYGIDFLEGLIGVSVRDEKTGIQMEGFISKRGNVRKTRGQQFLFVNRRPVADVALRHAIYKAYEDFIAREDHPIFFLHLRIDPSRIDVNVHPAKREIRFLDREEIYDGFLETIRTTLRAEKAGQEQSDEHGEISAGIYPGASLPVRGGRYERIESVPSEHGIADAGELSYETDRQYMYLGDVFVAFLEGARLCIMDHHAAHERVLYERLRKSIGLDSYRLLFPRQVRLNPKEYAVILAHKDTLNGMEIEIDDFGGNTVIVRTLPGAIDESSLDGLLSDLALKIMDITENSPVALIKDTIARSIACHSSVRGRRILGTDQLKKLIRDLDAADDPRHCPHGRPTRIYFSYDDLKKLFGRT
ncbi:MAG: DNA mismatch repair endonuclease MutL [bacterium]